MNHRPANRPARHHRCLAATAAAALLLLSTAAGAAGTAASRTDAEARDRQERAICMDGSSPQGRSSCLQEASAARAEARRHGLDNGETAAQLRANALQRCQRVNDDDRAACERMAQGGGQRSGTVAGGGVLMQITTAIVPAAPASAAAR